jgi:hypothetical protein
LLTRAAAARRRPQTTAISESLSSCRASKYPASASRGVPEAGLCCTSQTTLAPARRMLPTNKKQEKLGHHEILSPILARLHSVAEETRTGKAPDNGNSTRPPLRYSVSTRGDIFACPFLFFFLFWERGGGLKS